MSDLNLAALSDQEPYLIKIKDALESASGQKVPFINVGKVKRVAGVSSAPVEFVFSGQQRATLYIRAGKDAFKAELNGKAFVLSGDFSDHYKQSFEAGVKSISAAIRKNQVPFQKKMTAEKMQPIPQAKDSKGRLVPVNTSQKLKIAQADELAIDTQIADKMQIKATLEEQLTHLSNQTLNVE